MKVALIGAGVLMVGVALVYLWGRSMPREHVSSVSLEVGAAPEQVMAAITGYGEFPKWRLDVKKAEEKDGVVTEETGFGPISYRVIEKSERRLVTEIVADPQTSAFGGTWTYELEPMEKGTRVKITERGFVNPAVMRILSKYVFGHETTLKKFATDLERHLGKRG